MIQTQKSIYFFIQSMKIFLFWLKRIPQNYKVHI